MTRHRWFVVVCTAVALVVTSAPGPAQAAGWVPWTSLGEPPARRLGAPAIAARSGGQLDLFATSAHSVWHRAWNRDAGWGGWVDLGEPPVDHEIFELSAVAAVGRPDYKISIAVALRGDLWHRAWSTAGWGRWENLGHPARGIAAAPAISTRPTGDVDVWVVDANRSINHRIWSPSTGWRPWERPGGQALTSVAAVGHPDGSQFLFSIGTGGGIFQRIWRPGSGWSGWTDLGRPGDSAWPGPGAAVRPNGIVDLFALNKGHIYHRWRNTSGVWSAWGSIGGENIDTAPSAAGRPNGALDVVVGLPDDTIWHRAYG